MNKPLEITTPTHPMALSAYYCIIILGLLHITGLQRALALGDMTGDVVVGFWATVTSLAGGLALWGATLAARQKYNPTNYLRIERVGCILIVIVQVAYEVSLFWKFGTGSTLATQAYAISFMIGAFARAVQITQQNKGLRKSLRQNQPSDPPPLADATDNGT